MVNWYSLFSHTGAESAALQDQLSDVLELRVAITTNMKYNGSLKPLVQMPGKSINTCLMLPGFVMPKSIITLNGYMRILPEEVINYLHSIDCKIYNIHPAPIQLYPELRGKDPQERLYEGIQSGIYHYIGVVIHEVDAGVDTGKIVHWRAKLADVNASKEDLYAELHDMGETMWLELLREVAHDG